MWNSWLVVLVTSSGLALAIIAAVVIKFSRITATDPPDTETKPTKTVHKTSIQCADDSITKI